MERDVNHYNHPFIKYNFNSHAHVERDNLVADKIKMIEHFNSHAHVERDEFNLVSKSWIFNFNSHAHVERDHRQILNGDLPRISTHTLTWSVTRSL